MVGEASNPGPPRTRTHDRMEEEVEAVLIDDSSDDKARMPT